MRFVNKGARVKNLKVPKEKFPNIWHGFAGRHCCWGNRYRLTVYQKFQS